MAGRSWLVGPAASARGGDGGREAEASAGQTRQAGATDGAGGVSDDGIAALYE